MSRSVTGAAHSPRGQAGASVSLVRALHPGGRGREQTGERLDFKIKPE